MDSPGRIAIVEYLRGFAALSVAWFHLTNGYADSWVSTAGSYGWLGVEVFFVISGFILPVAISRTFDNYRIGDFPVFLARRIIRLEPPYIASIALALVLWQLSAIAPGFQGAPPHYETKQILAHLFYLIPFTHSDWLQPIYWTLAYEFAFYIILGLCFPAIGKEDKQLYFIVLSIGVGLCVFLDILPERSLLFIIGLCMFRLRCYRSDSLAANALLSIFCVGLIALSDPAIAFMGLASMACIHLFRVVSLPNICHKLLIQLGAISYSLYLTHVIIGGRVVNLGKRYVDIPWQQFLLSLFALFVCVLFSIVFRRLVEVPALVLSRRVFRAPNALVDPT
jgi:peptidoglycan/LPS O-acetylase OafA/YrhL